MKKYSALIIDDEPDIRQLIALTLSRMDMECYQAANVSEALALLAERPYHFCVTDMKLPDGNGLEIIQLCHARYADMPVAMITAYGSMDMAVEALKAGAFDVVAKPLDIARLRELVAAALQLTRVPVHLESLPSSDALLGRSGAMMALKDKIQKVARTQAPVFIHGESGTGKELVARLIHHQSSRADNPFIPVNCGAIPAELLESELFGHEKGAFTGAITARVGRFEMAEGGTLFLDEIGDMPLNMQVKILRVLQERTFERVGSNRTQSADVRVIAATHKHLEDMIESGDFREDLYYRLNVFPIEMPALRDRVEDIPLLINELISRMEKEKRGSLRMNSAAIMSLCRHDWPGNVRELANLVERLSIMHPYGVIGVQELPKKFRYVDDYDENRPVEDTGMPSGIPGLVGLDAPALLPVNGIDLKDYLSNLEKQLIQQALDEAGGVVARAAEKLRIRRTTLVEKVRKYGLREEESEES
jgi:sigma-54 specific flagellar transcriptional regulator A